MSFHKPYSATLATFIVVASILFAGCGGQLEPPIRIGTIVWPGYEFFYLARSLNYFKEATVQLVEYTSSSEALRGFKNNTLEAVALSGDEFLRLAEEQPDVRAIAILDFSFGGDALISQKGITNFAQLKGRVVGVEPNSVGTLLLTHALNQSGIARNEIILLHASNLQQEEMFLSGAIDAVATFEPTKTQLLKRGAHLLFDSRNIPHKILDVLVVRQKMIEENAERLTEALNAWFKAREYYLANKRHAAELMAERVKLAPEEFEKAMEGLIIPSKEENADFFEKSDNNVSPHFASMAQFLHQNGLLKTSLDPASFMDASIVRGPRK
ncbi:MAG: ABC transporter substrate-binding protein [Verrucomicrobiales bacterium]